MCLPADQGRKWGKRKKLLIFDSFSVLPVFSAVEQRMPYQGDFS